MPFDPTKPVKLRDGTPARIVCTDVKGPRPILALFDIEAGSLESPYRYYADGHVWPDREDSPLDLVNIEDGQ